MHQFFRHLLFAIGSLSIISGPVCLYYLTASSVGWSTIVVGIILMVASRFDEVVEIGFGTFKTKLERRVQSVEDAMNAVRLLARNMARNSLNDVQYAGRIGGFTEEEKLAFLAETRQLLSALDVGKPEIEAIERDWHAAVEFDYALWALGGNRLPVDQSRQVQVEWSKLRDGGIAGRPSPQQIRQFLAANDMESSESNAILDDYEHYIANQEHRCPDTWIRRDDNVPRFKK